jgi:hypothetical protein
MNPNLCPKVPRPSQARTQDPIAKVPLRELFWSVSATCPLFEEAEQRISSALAKALNPEAVQLFDDLYESLAS